MERVPAADDVGRDGRQLARELRSLCPRITLVAALCRGRRFSKDVPIARFRRTHIRPRKLHDPG